MKKKRRTRSRRYTAAKAQGVATLSDFDRLLPLLPVGRQRLFDETFHQLGLLDGEVDDVQDLVLREGHATRFLDHA